MLLFCWLEKSGCYSIVENFDCGFFLFFRFSHSLLGFVDCRKTTELENSCFFQILEDFLGEKNFLCSSLSSKLVIMLQTPFMSRKFYLNSQDIENFVHWVLRKPFDRSFFNLITQSKNSKHLEPSSQ